MCCFEFYFIVLGGMPGQAQQFSNLTVIIRAYAWAGPGVYRYVPASSI